MVEVVSVRMLAPYFGNTIYSLSSILSVTLLALSLGYYFGGKLSDRFPRWNLFFGIIAAAGIAVGLMRAVSHPLLFALSQTTSATSGPLVASLLLFLVPAVFLGMLSPFAIKLEYAMEPKQGVGSVAGLMFFWSTVGSIAGSLLAGFVLIPRLEIQTILLAVAGLLLLLGCTGILLTGRITRSGLMLAVFTLPLAVLALLPFRKNLPPEILLETEGMYQTIRVVDGEMRGKPAHLLFQDRNFSSATFNESDDLVFEYAPYYRLGMEFRKAPLKRALFIGAGAFSMPRDLLLRDPDAEVDVVDIEPGLFDIAVRYFRLQPSDQLRFAIQDGRFFLRKSEQSYDLIFSDVYQDFLAIPSHIATREFFALGREKLSNDGMFIANVIGSLKDSDHSFLFSEMRTFRESFPVSRFFAVHSRTSATLQNTIFLGCNDEESCIDPCSETFRAHSERFFRELCGKEIDPIAFALERYPFLTDEYAPVEYLAARSILAQ